MPQNCTSNIKDLVDNDKMVSVNLVDNDILGIKHFSLYSLSV